MITKQGDTFESISFKEYGSSKYMGNIIDANRKHINTFIFNSGVELTIPAIETNDNSNAPSWRK